MKGGIIIYTLEEMKKNAVIKNDHRYDYAEYESLDLPEEYRVEIIDGYIYPMETPDLSHQEILVCIATSIFQFIKDNKEKCIFLSPTVDVRLEYDKGDMTVVRPDAMVFYDRDLKGCDRYINGAPDFILEVVTYSTRRMDMYVKKTKYKENGVREYWIVDYDSDKIIKHNFEKGDKVTSYTFKDKIPVDIFDGRLIIDCKEIKEYVESWWN